MSPDPPRSAEEQVAALRRQRTVLAEFGNQALRGTDLDALLQEASARVSEALEVKLVKVLELLPDGETMLVRAGVNWHPGVVGRATFGAHEHSPSGYALKHDAPVISRDTATETRFEIPAVMREHGVKSMVNVVIRGEHKPFGVLEVDAPEHRAFDEDDVNFLQNYANLLASAIDRLRAQRELEELAASRKLLMQELQHRVNNVLTNVRALLMKCRSTSRTVDELVAAVESRLGALARTQDLLMRVRDERADLRELIRLELAAHGADETRHYVLEGPDLALPPRLVQLLSLALHELATNAVKHGALAAEHGRIAISWSTEPSGRVDQLHLRWRETGVPIEGPPPHRGFGSEIIEQSLPYMVGGSAALTFEPDGVQCVICMPLEGAGAPSAAPAGP